MSDGQSMTLKIGDQVYPAKRVRVAETPREQALDGFGWKGEPIEMSYSIKLTPAEAPKWQRVLSGRDLPLKKRKRIQRKNRRRRTMTLGLVPGDHRNWMILGRAACERDYREVSRG